MPDSHAFINGDSYRLEPGETLYEFVSRQLGGEIIPVLCHDPVLEPLVPVVSVVLRSPLRLRVHVV